MAEGIRSLVKPAVRKAVKKSRPGLLEALRMDIPRYRPFHEPAIPVVAPPQPIMEDRAGREQRYEEPIYNLYPDPYAAVGAERPISEDREDRFRPGGPGLREALRMDIPTLLAPATPAAPAAPQSIMEDRLTREQRYEEPVYNLNPDPVAASGREQATLPGFVREAIDPWVGLGKDIYGNVLTPIGHAIRDTYVDPNADPNAEPYFGDPMSDTAPMVNAPPYDPTRNPDRTKDDAVSTTPGSAPLPEVSSPPGRLSPEYVLPPEELPPGSQPPVTPASGIEPPDIDPSGLPGASTETATGALSLDDYMAKIKQTFPDLDWSNPKQAEADANARRDLDRTAMLAQLQLAAGIVKGAGVGWEGIGIGFEGATGAYDKGFQKYQQALQDSADRYGKQKESQIAYDTARRQAALGLYTSATSAMREDQRALWTEREKRRWDIHKEGVETEREGRKLTDQNIRDYFGKQLDGLKLPTDAATMAPEELAELQKKRQAVLTAMQNSLIEGEIVAPDDIGIDVTGAD